jgi:drug/metabolite transporter (DMT)-like permease
VSWCLAAAALFGATTPLAKPLVDEMGPLLLSGLLYWGAALAVFPAALADWRRHRRHRLHYRSGRANRGRLLGAAFFGGVVGPVFLLWGLSLAPAGSVSLWLTLETVATAVLARLFFRETLGAMGWLATLLVVIASAALAAPELGGAKAALLVGIACVAWGLDNNLTALIDGYSTSEITWFKGICAGALTIPIGWLAGGQVSPATLTFALLVGAVGYGASLVLYIAASQQLGAIRSQLYFSTAPLFGLAVAWGGFGESIGLQHLIAIVLMTTALWLLHRESHSHDHQHEALIHTHWHRHDDGHHQHEHDQAASSGIWHQHPHEHAALTHGHAHRPDLHHRHLHESQRRVRSRATP